MQTNIVFCGPNTPSPLRPDAAIGRISGSSGEGDRTDNSTPVDSGEAAFISDPNLAVLPFANRPDLAVHDAVTLRVHDNGRLAQLNQSFFCSNPKGSLGIFFHANPRTFIGKVSHIDSVPISAIPSSKNFVAGASPHVTGPILKN